MVGDNVSCNLNAQQLIGEAYPKLELAGCAAHCLDLLCEDVAELDIIADDPGVGKAIIVLVKRHKINWSRFR